MKVTNEVKVDESLPCSAKAVANFFIELAEKKGDRTLTPMKLQKLVYFAHGWHLALTGTPLIKEEIEAWKFGPVVRSLYDAFKEFGNALITSLAKNLRFDGKNMGREIPKLPDNSSATALLNRIWEVYGKYGGPQLSNATHMSGTPWFEVWENEGKHKLSVGIPDATIRKYFQGQLENRKNRETEASGSS